MTLSDLLSECYIALDLPSSPASTTTTRLTLFLNRAMQELLKEPGLAEWITRNEPQQTFSSVASQPVYAIWATVERIDAIVEHTTRRRLTARSLDWYRAIEPDYTRISGTPRDFVPYGFMAVAVQPQTTGIWAVSSNSGDTSQTVYLETIRSAGQPNSGSLTLNGTTRVQYGALTDHVQIVKFYLSATTTGDISLYDAASTGNLLATIPAGQTFSRYLSLALYPTPSTAITYYVDGPRPLRDLVNPTDEVPIPPGFHELLVDGALVREFSRKDDDTRMQRAAGRYAKKLADLRYFVTCPGDYLPVAGRLTPQPPSRLGPWFPNGAGVF